MAAGLQYFTSITATTSGGSVSFVVPGATGITLNANRVSVINTGSSDPVYFNFVSTTGATTGDYPIAAGTTFTVTASRGYFTGLSYTTTAAASSVCRVIAICG